MATSSDGAAVSRSTAAPRFRPPGSGWVGLLILLTSCRSDSFQETPALWEPGLSCAADADCPNGRCRCTVQVGPRVVGVCCRDDEPSVRPTVFDSRWERLGPWNTGENALPAEGLVDLRATPAGTVWAIAFDPETGRTPGVVRVDALGWGFLGAEWEGLRYSAMTTLLPTRDGGFWVAAEHVLLLWDGAGLAEIALPASNQGQTISALAESGPGTVWVGQTDLMRLDPGGIWAIFTPANSPLPGSPIEAMAGHPDGRVLVATQEDLLVLGPPGEPIPMPPVPAAPDSYEVSSVFVDSAGRCFAGGPGWIAELGTGEWEDAWPVPGFRPDAWAEAGGTLWIADASSCRLLVGPVGDMETYEACAPEQDGQIGGIGLDAEGRLWVGTTRGGLRIWPDPLAGPAGATALRADGCPATPVAGVSAGADGSVALVTEEGDIHGLAPGGAWGKKTDRSSLPGLTDALPATEHGMWLRTESRVLWLHDDASPVEALAGSYRLLLAEKDGALLASDPDGLVRVRLGAEGSAPSVLRLGALPLSHQPVSGFAAPGGDIWLLDGGSAAVSVDGQTWTGVPFAPSEGVSPLAGCASPDGAVWVIESSAVHRLQPDGRFAELPPLDIGLISAKYPGLRAVACRSDVDEQWFLEEDGVSIRRAGAWEQYPFGDGFPACSTHSSPSGRLIVLMPGQGLVADGCGLLSLEPEGGPPGGG